ncbi:MAG: hypothetical protein WC554_09910 [Clostridia bacterium]
MKNLYEFMSSDSKELIFVIADNILNASMIATQKSKEEGLLNYVYDSSDCIDHDVRIDPTEENRVIEYVKL